MARFYENYDNIELDWVGDTYRDTMSQLNTQLAAGDAPDVFHNDGVFFARNRDAGFARSLTEYTKRDAGQLEGIRGPEFFSDEKQDVYGVCMGVGCSAFAYNTDIFDRMGINRLPAEGIDWNPGDGGTLLEIASDITAKGENEDPKLWGFFNNKQITFDVLGMLIQNGTNFLTDDYRRSRIHEPEFVAVIQFLWDLEFKYRVSPNPDDIAEFNASIPEGVRLPRTFCLATGSHDESRPRPVRFLGFAGTGKTTHRSGAVHQRPGKQQSAWRRTCGRDVGQHRSARRSLGSDEVPVGRS